MQKPKLFAKLPEYACTPDGMAIDSEGNLALACPNFADLSKPGCLLKIDERRNIRKWVDVPVSEETGHAFPMGIAFGPDGDLYICDSQGWSGAPELVFKGRIHRNHAYLTHSTLFNVKDPSTLMTKTSRS